MANVEIMFRGIFTVVLNQPEGKPESARVLLPSGYFPRLAKSNPEHIITGHLPFVAVPLRQEEGVLRLPTDGNGENAMSPKFICALNPSEHPAGGIVLDPEGEVSETRYAVYPLEYHEITLETDAQRTAFSYCMESVDDRQPLALKEEEIHNRRSMQWAAEIETLGEDIRFIDAFASADPPRECAAFVDLNAGELEPVHDRDVQVHVWRFLHSESPIERDIPDGLRVKMDVDGGLRIRLRDRKTGETFVIQPELSEGSTIIIGNEPLADILDMEFPRFCADPAYHYELQYLFFEHDKQLPVPMPVCVAEHVVERDPPRAKCGNLSVVVR
jgi:hypothetical protein